MSAARTKTGRYVTVNMVCDLLRNNDSPEPTRENIKSDFSFINPVHEICAKLASNK